MIRKQFRPAPGDEAAASCLEEARSQGSSTDLRCVLLIEKRENASYVPLSGAVSVADARDGHLLRCELSEGRICISEDQTIVLSDLAPGTQLRITEEKGNVMFRGNTAYEMTCAAPDRKAQVVRSLTDVVMDVVFVNELHSVCTDPQTLVSKEFLSGDSAWSRVPDGAVLAFCLERYEGGNWLSAEGILWVQCLGGVPCREWNKTGPDGIIRVSREPASSAEAAAGFPILPIAIHDGSVKTQLYYLEHEAQEGDLRIREVPDLSDPSFGMLSGCEGNTFFNENAMQEVIVEKQTDQESGQRFTMKIVQRIGDVLLPGRYLTYQVRNASSGLAAGSGKTDAEGCFSLSGGTQAVFSLAEGTGWEVTEISGGSWKLSSVTMEHTPSNPSGTDRGMRFDLRPVRHDMTLTNALLGERLTDPLTGAVLDFTGPDITIPHYVCRGEEILEITRIGDGLFSGAGIRSVEIAPGIRRIGSDAFFACESLERILLPDTVEEFGDTCFCLTAIRSLEIPASVKRTGEGIVAACFSLEQIIIHQNPSQSPFSAYAWDTYTDTDVIFIE